MWFKYEKRTKKDEIKTVKAELKISRNAANAIKNFILRKNFVIT